MVFDILYIIIRFHVIVFFVNLTLFKVLMIDYLLLH